MEECYICRDLKTKGEYKYTTCNYTSIAITKGKNGRYRCFAWGEGAASISCNYCPNCGRRIELQMTKEEHDEIQHDLESRYIGYASPIRTKITKVYVDYNMNNQSMNRVEDEYGNIFFINDLGDRDLILDAFLLANIPDIITQKEFDDVQSAIIDLREENKELKEQVKRKIQTTNKTIEFLSRGVNFCENDSQGLYDKCNIAINREKEAIKILKGEK